MDRRKFLATVSSGSVAIGLAGCSGEMPEEVEELPRPTLGSDSAETVVRVFSDFSCTGCATFDENVFPEIQERFITNDKIRYEHYDYVIPASDKSFFRHNVARGVQDVAGEEEFWDLKAWLFRNQNRVGTNPLRDKVRALGITNPGELFNRATNGVYDPVLRQDKEFGNDSYGSPYVSTPTVVVNGETVPPFELPTVFSAIENELE